MTKRRLFVVLPAYNEEPSLERLLDKIIAVGEAEGIALTILVCNDGSRDGTGSILERRAASDSRIRVLPHKINRGLGETIRDLFELAAESAGNDDIIVRLDGDDTHDPKYIPGMLRKLDEGYDVVIASRFQEGGGQRGLDLYRRTVSYCANTFMRVVFWIPNVREFSCGFRVYRARLLRQAITFYGNDFIQLKGFGFACTLEKLVKLHLLGARFAEIGFEHRYDRKESESKMIGSITTLGYLLMALLYHWPWGGWRRYYGARRQSLEAEHGKGVKA